MFGDIVDTFGQAVEGIDVDGCDGLVAEDNLEDTVSLCRPEGDLFAAEGLGQSDCVR